MPVRTEQEIGNCRGLEMECYVEENEVEGTEGEARQSKDRAEVEEEEKEEEIYIYIYTSAVYMVTLRSCRKERQRERKAVNERIGSGKERQLAY